MNDSTNTPSVNQFIHNPSDSLGGYINVEEIEKNDCYYEPELRYYKELFSKLKVSYIEQETKERYLRCLLDNPPILVEPDENAQLDRLNAQQKSKLKEKKRAVEQLIDHIETGCTNLSNEYLTLTDSCNSTNKLLTEIAELEKSLHELQQDEQAKRPVLSDLELKIEQASTELKELEKRCNSTSSQKTTEENRLKLLEKEFSVLQTTNENLEEKASSIRSELASETTKNSARKDVEQWYKSVIQIYKKLSVNPNDE
ncbi:Bfr1 binding protein [Schizosaccharomyces japonicus yFS275]|uniref:Bfr1 binding protein n=1 Tax=Schizosaccharomyces japonicus (strain yFS275 / FY16936) TaxID=402676 RepID=B6K3Y1_SCHJY|nr:Bfr1 binding protein [Schizosaccharomyces japonicus yFS275]EEB08188.2 Bfr1 binding protein [Schizosaccharomyces japonicus yFS275]